jgi:O-antigen ligase
VRSVLSYSDTNTGESEAFTAGRAGVYPRATWAIPYSLPRFGRFVLVVSVMLIPFTQVYLPGTGQRNSLSSLSEVLVLLALCLHPRVYLRNIPRPILALLLYLGVRVFAGLIITPDLLPQWWDSSRGILRPLLWSLVLATGMRSPRMAHRLLWTYLVACGLAASLHIAGLGGTYHLGTASEWRSSAFGQNANQLGMIYATGFVTALGMALSSRLAPRRRVLGRIVLIAMMLLSARAVVLTGSRGAMLLVVLGSVLLSLPLGRLRIAGRQVFMVAVACAMLGAVIAQNPAVIVRFQELRDRGLESEPRVPMTGYLVDVFSRSPLWGSGPEGYRSLIAQLSYSEGQAFVGMTAHNNLLMVAAENGLLGLLPFLYALCWLLAAAWRLRPAVGNLPAAAITPVLLLGMTTGNFMFHWHFYFLMGLICGLHNSTPTTDPSTSDDAASYQEA